MTRTLSLMIVIGGATALVVFMMAQGHDPIGGLLRQDEMASLGIKLIWAVFFGGLVLAAFRGKLSRAIEAIFLWGLIAVLIGVGYTYRYELGEVADRVLAELIPGRAATRGNSVEVVRTAGGDFAVDARVNSAAVPMVLDTGASSVVLTTDAARDAGLPTAFLSYSVRVDTANGHTQAAPVTLDRVSIGGITERGVPALIAQPGQLKTSLLGMTFLNRLESWEVRGTRLVLRAHPVKAR